jgi:hypothetical protein
MAFNTTDTTTFNVSLSDALEEAFERCGAELRSGYDFRTARRSLNLMLADWANRGINMWTIEEGSFPMVAGTGTYNLPVDTVDLLEHVIRTGSGNTQTDINISRVSVSTWAAIPNKTATGRPIQVWIQRKTGANDSAGDPVPPQVHVWPLPDSSQSYTFVYWRMRRIQDAGTGLSGQDIPFRFLPPLVAGLAYYLSMKLPTVDPQRRMELKADYEQQFQLAADEDREKASVRFVPRQQFV